MRPFTLLRSQVLIWDSSEITGKANEIRLEGLVWRISDKWSKKSSPIIRMGLGVIWSAPLNYSEHFDFTVLTPVLRYGNTNTCCWGCQLTQCMCMFVKRQRSDRATNRELSSCWLECNICHTHAALPLQRASPTEFKTDLAEVEDYNNVSLFQVPVLYLHKISPCTSPILFKDYLEFSIVF